MVTPMNSSQLKKNTNLKGKILLVDDEKLVRKTTVEMLEHLGFDVLYAVDGLQGVTQFKYYHEELLMVIMDVIMPKANGFEAMNMMKRYNPNIPIILMSARHEYASSKPKAFENPAAFMTKPFRLKELKETIEQTFAKQTHEQ